MGDIRELLVHRLNRRIEHLKGAQRRLNERHLQDQLLDRALARLVRVRDRTSTLGRAEKGA